MSEHTPTPWRFDADWHRLPTIFGSDGKMVAYVEKDKREATPERAANAALIIKAVNSHDALVKALEDLLGRSQAVHQWLTNWDVPFADDDEWAGDKKLFAEARNEAARVLGAVGATKQP